MAKTKDYVARANKNYMDKFDRVSLRLPKGTADMIRELTCDSVNNYVTNLIAKDLRDQYQVDIFEE